MHINSRERQLPIKQSLKIRTKVSLLRHPPTVEKVSSPTTYSPLSVPIRDSPGLTTDSRLEKVSLTMVWSSSQVSLSLSKLCRQSTRPRPPLAGERRVRPVSCWSERRAVQPRHRHSVGGGGERGVGERKVGEIRHSGRRNVPILHSLMKLL